MTFPRLGYRFKDPSLLETALTHSSYANQFSCRSNERLEFLGDALLGCMVGKMLYERYPSLSEGDLTRSRSCVVNGANLAKYGAALGLGEKMRFGKGEGGPEARRSKSATADAFEALVGALYLDAGYGKTFEIVSRLLRDDIERGDFSPDSKTELQEICQSLFGEAPEYRVTSEEGPDHKKTFTTEVKVASDLSGRGRGGSKKQSEQSAARDALRKLGY